MSTQSTRREPELPGHNLDIIENVKNEYTRFVPDAFKEESAVSEGRFIESDSAVKLSEAR